jgi:glycosyltransferase involved in cell wall biosynthesis
MTAAPLVSVVVPTYNRAHLLPETLESIFAQTYPELEVIVVDDGSQDDTAGAIARFCDRIAYLRQENRGLAAARTAGQRRARGEYVAWLDSDDLWNPEKIALQVAFMRQRPDHVVVASDFSAFDAHGFFERSQVRLEFSVIDRTPGGLTGIFPERIDLVPRDLPFVGATLPEMVGVHCGGGYEQFVWGSCLLPSTVLFRRATAMQTGPLDASFLLDSDYEYLLRLSRLGRVAFIDHPLTRYRFSEEQMSSDKHLAEIALSRLRVFASIRAQDPALYRRHRKAFRRRVGAAHLSAAHAIADQSRGTALYHLLCSVRAGWIAGETVRTVAKLCLPRWAIDDYRKRRVV